MGLTHKYDYGVQRGIRDDAAPFSYVDTKERCEKGEW
jgi:hypothetical protein